MSKRKPDIFSIKNEDGLSALPGWLQQRSYNTWNGNIKDRFGNALVGLSWAENPSAPSPDMKRAGLIVVADARLRGRIIDIVRENAQ